MLYFRITVSPVTFMGESTPITQAVAHVMVDDLDIETAAARVVKKLYTERWRVASVQRACQLGREERFRGNELMTRLLSEAEDTGFSYFIDWPRGQGPHPVFTDTQQGESVESGRLSDV
jgi:hypothetical protein